MKRLIRILKARYSRKVIIYLLICCLVLNTSLPVVLATPSGASPGGGGFSIQYGVGQYENTTLVNVLSDRTIINWDSLDTLGGSVGVRETLAFTQDGFNGSPALTNSAVLNRIYGDATQFNGDLSAPGMRIFMVNPAGIVFGEGASVNVSQLVASGLKMSKEAFHDFLDDGSKPMVFSGGNGQVENHGTITANSVILVGDKVVNLGSIFANEGFVVMAAGDNVYLAQDSSQVYVEILEDPLNTTEDVQNGGLINADNGKIILAAGDTFSRAVSNFGTLAAAGGEVKMQAANVENNGMITVSSDTNGGSVDLVGAETVTIGPDDLGTTGIIEANAGTNGIGGTITIKAGSETVEGKVTIEKNSLITATGGSELGIEDEVPAGGTVTITSDKFEIAGDIDASPGNNTFEQGELVINSSSVIIADGPNPTDLDPPAEPAENTLYEEDIENLTFDDVTDTIRTTLGDIIIEAGSGGISIGNLTTGKKVSDDKPLPGHIHLSTSDGGDIITGDLTIENGMGLAQIEVDSSGNLTVNGDVIVGRESDIVNVPNGQNAHAAIYLSAADNMELNGSVGAYAKGIDDGITENDKTLAEIRILSGTNLDMNGDAYIGGDIVADAESSNEGTAEAIVEVDAFGNVTFAEGAVAHAIVDGGLAEAGPGTESDEEFSEEDPPSHAQIIITSQDYPKPPMIGVSDEFTTSKSDAVPVDVLSNDTQDGELVADAKIDSYTEPTEGSLTLVREGDIIVSFEYNPPEDLSTITFDENGKATVTFTYVGQVVVEGEELLSEETTVTIKLVNNLPGPINDLATTIPNRPIDINVLTNDKDLDLDDVLTVIEGTVTPKNGTLVLNDDGTFTYTPNKGFLGEDSFTYSATDGFNTSSEVEVKITVAEAPENPAPGLDRIGRVDVEVSGCPALAKWVAKELGVDASSIEIRMANSLASNKGIQPYDTYSKFRNAAIILQDADGGHMAALVQVINEFASSTGPLSEEQVITIANAITGSTDEESYYAIADKYLDALATYINILSSEMGVSKTESARFVTYKYISPLTQDQNVGVAAFLAACSSVLGG